MNNEFILGETEKDLIWHFNLSSTRIIFKHFRGQGNVLILITVCRQLLSERCHMTQIYNRTGDL